MKTKKELIAAAVEKWNADIKILDQYIIESKIPRHEFDMWELVWQEIVMYTQLERQIEFEDLQIIIERRGFNELQSKYLKEMLIHIGIGDILSGKSNAVFLEAEKKSKESEQEYMKKLAERKL